MKIAERFPSDPIAAVTHANPYPYYADLVARAPLAYDDALGLWVAASAEAVTAVLTSDLCRVRPSAEPVPRALLGSSAAEIFGRFVRMNDGPRHHVLKQAVAATLGSLDETRLAGPSREWARQLAAELAETADSRLVTDFAFRLPIYTVGSLLGVPQDQLPRLARSMGDFVTAAAPGSLPEAVERGKEAADLLLGLFRSLLVDPDAVGLLPILAREAHAVGENEDEAILANGIGFLFQAHDATAGLIGNTLLALAAQPETRRQAASDPGRLRQVLQEVVRYDPPIQNTRRFVARDGLVAGCSLKEGDAVLVVLAAANRDPAVEDGRCFTFGIGPHACPGETLATTIAKAGIESLLHAGIDFERLADSVIYRPSANARIPLFGSRPEIS
ncbi:MAG TPA: cytochrome P450 [Thermoanaerobaculia bacterium]|nr:cytochrome P450 [Thermoanaerobaculia bacterium]